MMSLPQCGCPGAGLRVRGLLAAAGLLLLGLPGCGEKPADAEKKSPEPARQELAQEAIELREKTAPEPLPPPAPPAPDLSPKLIGAWEYNQRMPADRAQVWGVTSFHPDGRLEVTGTVRAAHRVFDIHAAGRWTLDGEVLTTVIETSSYPELLPVGHTERDRIEDITEDQLTYTDARGQRWTEQRLR